MAEEDGRCGLPGWADVFPPRPIFCRQLRAQHPYPVPPSWPACRAVTTPTPRYACPACRACTSARSAICRWSQVGARVEWLGQDGFPPLALKPALLGAELGERRGNVSSQFLHRPARLHHWCAGQAARHRSRGETDQRPYVEITSTLMAFGVKSSATAGASSVPASQRYTSPGRIAVEGDASTASYFLAPGRLAVRVVRGWPPEHQGDVKFAGRAGGDGRRNHLGRRLDRSPGAASGSGPSTSISTISRMRR